jgi:hypothetical protein
LATVGVVADDDDLRSGLRSAQFQTRRKDFEPRWRADLNGFERGFLRGSLESQATENHQAGDKPVHARNPC